MAAEYKVLKIDELVRPGEAGGIERFYRHQVKTARGIVLTVDVEEKDFTPEKAATILKATAVNADKVLTL